MKPQYAQKILEETRRNYNLIAEDFSRTRDKLWPELGFLSENVKDGDRVLDLGCGNGRLTVLFKDKDIEYIGADNSEKLIEIARKKYSSGKFRFVVADGLNLPFPDDHFDKVFSIAVLHHIPSKELRMKFLRETYRVLKKDGYVVFTVWNLWQKKGIFINIKYFFGKIFGLSRLDFKDVTVPWGGKLNRYFHAFAKRELKNIFINAGFAVSKTGLIFRKGRGWNYFIIAKKI